MKKLVYLLLAAVLAFGFQTESYSVSVEEGNGLTGESGKAKIVFTQADQVLHLFLTTARNKEYVRVYVNFKNSSITKEVFLVTQSDDHFTINLEGQPNGDYTVKIVGESIELQDHFRKK